MLQRLIYRYALILILLTGTGCVAARPATLAPPPVKEPPLAPTANSATAVRTMLPQTATPPPGCAYPASSSGICALSTATLPAGAGAYPAPLQTASPPGAASAYPAAPQGSAPALLQSNLSTPFSDCARTPQIFGCDVQAPAIPGHLAFFDPDIKRLVVLNLEDGSGWQTALSADWLKWSPNGQRLLVSVGDQGYQVYSADGRQAQSFTAPPDQPTPDWLNDGTVSLDGAVRAADGLEARLEYTADLNWLLHLTPPGGKEQLLPVPTQSPDQLVSLVDFIPGTQKLLAQRYYANNSAMIFGGELITIDTTDGSVASLNVTAPLGMRAVFAWQPRPAGQVDQPGRLAFLVSGTEQNNMQARLALLDFQTGQLRYPLPDGLDIEGLTWQPDGQRLAFSVTSVSDALSPANASATFTGPGIYRLDPATGAVELLAKANPAGTDGWPRFSAGGAFLLYAQTLPAAGGASGVRVIARRLADGKEFQLVVGLPAPDSILGQDLWRKILAFNPA